MVISRDLSPSMFFQPQCTRILPLACSCFAPSCFGLFLFVVKVKQEILTVVALECYRDLCISPTRAVIQGDDSEIAGVRVAQSQNTSVTLFPHFSLLHRRCFLQSLKPNQNGFISSVESAKESSLECTKSLPINILRN